MKHFKLDDDLFNVRLLFCWDADDKALSEFVMRKFNVDISGDHTGDGYFVRLENLDGRDIGIIAMSDPVFSGTPYQYSVLAHECMHASFRFLKSRGIRYSKSSEECFTYFTDNLIEKIATKALAYEARHK